MRTVSKMDNSSNSKIYMYNYEDEHIFQDPRVRVVLIVGYSLVFFFCFFGNLVVFLVMCLHWRMRIAKKFCLCNLAFANLCVGAFCVYQDLSLYLVDSWVFGKFVCKMHHFTKDLAHTASILILVVISVERYFAILKPFKCQRIFTTRRLRLGILLVWIVSALLSSPRLYYTVTITHSMFGKKEVICTLLLTIYDSDIADIIHFVLLFLLPLTIISVLYIKIGLYLRRREKFVNSFALASSAATTNSEKNTQLRSQQILRHLNTNDVSLPEAHNQRNGTQEKKKCHQCEPEPGIKCPACTLKGNTIIVHSHKKDLFDRTWKAGFNRHENSLWKSGRSVNGEVNRNRNPLTSLKSTHKDVVRLLITIVFTFALCNFPFHLRKIHQIFVPPGTADSAWTDLMTPLTYLLMYTNCAVNPILFAFMNRGFRSCLLDCLRGRVRKPSNSRG